MFDFWICFGTFCVAPAQTCLATRNHYFLGRDMEYAYCSRRHHHFGFVHILQRLQSALLLFFLDIYFVYNSLLFLYLFMIYFKDAYLSLSVTLFILDFSTSVGIWEGSWIKVNGVIPKNVLGYRELFLLFPLGVHILRSRALVWYLSL